MYLERINKPQDLKTLKIKELKSLAEEIRGYIIEVVGRRGGHLASNLGVVELTLALHYILNLPQDKIIWDVGHQCYTHKLLTGRRELFKRLRILGGMSGFPSPQESEYDIFYTGHASTAISLSLGLCVARDIKREDFEVVCVVGDGSLTGGLSFEALNNCGHLRKDILVILNSNEMSISKSVGALSSYINRIISNPLYNKIRRELQNFIKTLPFASRGIAHLAKKFEESIKNILVPGVLFEELGFRYFGPLDGHNLKVLIPTLKNVINLEGPKILHIITKKGKGYKPAQENPERFHSSKPFLLSLKEKETFTKVFSKKLMTLAKTNRDIVAITAAMKEGTGLSEFARVFPERFFDVGIAEEHAVAFAGGLCKMGLKPVVAIYSTFLQRAYDQLIHDISLQGLSPVFILDRAGLVGEDGPTHHGVFDIAYLRTIPEFVVMAPKDREELEDMLEFALGISQPVSIRFPKEEAFSLNRRTPIKISLPEIIQEGEDICFLSLGTIIKSLLLALPMLHAQGINPGIVNARFVNPLDEDFIEEIASGYRLIITLEEGILDGGFGSKVMEIFQKRDLPLQRIKRIGLPQEFITFGKREDLLNIYGLSPQGIAEKALSFLKEERLV